ncbi:oxidoreductase-like domain-containing protein [Variovorax sp. OV329]|uniref:oxidoreductase-like domain-containing protein n=1 Tax=Variovorax sp. OV329 TaxID=1882825 RepID=UPI0008E8DA8B|nr:oxidoreductase-like domain-containing protein [Variovorax sp. OV329]SFM05009.1 Oxidoreductase-like protein, N-terminal [Variovorax sp. OV329]
MAPAVMDALPQVVDAASARELIAALSAHLRALGIEPGEGFRKPPPEPTGCCGRGCNGCVWEGYYAALQWWREDAIDLLAAALSVK